MTILAQITEAGATDLTGGLMRYGVVGALAAVLLYRDWRRADSQEKREVERITRQEERFAKQEQQLQQVLDSLNSLVRAISLEVLTRPAIIERARAEAQELIDSTKR